MTGGIPFPLKISRAPASVNADAMTIDEIHSMLRDGYNDIEKGNVQDASAVFEKFRDTYS